jgi:predicted GNAT family N-acyltransferase
MSYITVPLNSSYNKKNFFCGKSSLDNYIQTQASQDVKKRIAACFVLLDENQNVTGYYTLSNDSIPQKNLPDAIKKKMPKSYINLPVTLLGRLAVDSKAKGRGYGELLLLDALKRSYDTSLASIASMAVVVDPLDEEAMKFYKKYGFIELPDSGKMFIPMQTISILIA